MKIANKTLFTQRASAGAIIASIAAAATLGGAATIAANVTLLFATIVYAGIRSNS